MYKFDYDDKTGGLILTNETSGSPLSAKEPRPVYASELMQLLPEKYYSKFDNDDSAPIMWAEKNLYKYKAKDMFSLVGGDLHTQPRIAFSLTIKDGIPTDKRTIDSEEHFDLIDMKKMIDRNRTMINVIEQTTIKRIYDYYRRKLKEVDTFHVAFSGGKDSVVLLELVKRALPKNAYIVVFGDTGMEFPDTYKLVDDIEQECQEEGISFYRASSSFVPEESWGLFGPPSRTLRWCCSVHKSVPQTLKIRDILGIDNYRGVDFVGVRRAESVARASYDDEGFEMKQKGQFVKHPIIDWESSEIWLYTFARNLHINEAYKKGNSRVGCLYCPMSAGNPLYFRHNSYPKEVDRFISLIEDSINDPNMETYVTKGWRERRSGRDLKNNIRRYSIEIKDDVLTIQVRSPRSDWREWIKTIDTTGLKYSVEYDEDGYIVTAPATINKTTFGKLFKQVFRKAAYCVSCGLCESNCYNGRLSFKDGLVIKNCLQCHKCHEVTEGCMAYESNRLPQENEDSKPMTTINAYQSHSPKSEWVQSFFKDPETFLQSNSLGPNQDRYFRDFLTHAQLVEETSEQKKGKARNLSVSSFTNLISKIGKESTDAWALILINLSYNSGLVRWFVDNISIDVPLTKSYLTERLINEEGLNKRAADDVTRAFGKLVEMQLGKILHFGSYQKVSSDYQIVRHKAPQVDPRVILYSLYRYAEASSGYYQFTLRYLTDPNSQSAGVSPSKLFGLTSDELEPTLRGLSILYSDYISTAFTHDLDKITLNSEVKSDQILELF